MRALGWRILGTIAYLFLLWSFIKGTVYEFQDNPDILTALKLAIYWSIFIWGLRKMHVSMFYDMWFNKNYYN